MLDSEDEWVDSILLPKVLSFESILFAFCTINFRVFRQLSGRIGAFLVRFDTNLFQAANRLFLQARIAKTALFKRKRKVLCQN
jgi:hypothetical protein